MDRPPPAKKSKIEARKLEGGLQRELYQLLGNNAPPTLARQDTKFAARPDWQQGPTPWTWQPFTNRRARGDSLELFHWVRGTGGDRDGIYAFAKYDVAAPVPEWTEEDWDTAELASDSWTLEETRYLFNLAKEYSLRWLVIADRYEFPENERTVDDLKERYYEVVVKLLQLHGETDSGILTANTFDKAAELRRKAHLQRLLSRTPSEVAEEEALVLEARRLESQADIALLERQRILTLLESPLSEGSIAAYTSSAGLAQLQQELMSSKSKQITDPQGPSAVRKSLTATEGAPPLAPAQAVRRRFGPKEEAAFGISYHDKLSSGVFLRTTRLPALRQSVQQRSAAVLNELGLPSKPVMPTAKVCAEYELLMQKVGVLLDTKRAADKLAAEIATINAAN